MQLFQQKAANPNADSLQQQQKREEVTHTQKKTCSSHGFYMSTTRTATQWSAVFAQKRSGHAPAIKLTKKTFFYCVHFSLEMSGESWNYCNSTLPPPPPPNLERPFCLPVHEFSESKFDVFIHVKGLTQNGEPQRKNFNNNNKTLTHSHKTPKDTSTWTHTRSYTYLSVSVCLSVSLSHTHT